MSKQREPSRNIDGKRITRMGVVDSRHNNRPKVENDGKAYARFAVVFAERDTDRQWHVIRIEIESGAQSLISRHRLSATAEKHADRHRIKQPDRKASPKFRHKLGLP